MCAAEGLLAAMAFAPFVIQTRVAEVWEAGRGEEKCRASEKNLDLHLLSLSH